MSPLFEQLHWSDWFLPTLQFLMRYPELPTIVWCDMMKCGRTTMSEIDEMVTLMAHVLHKRPKGVGILIAPFLVSEKQAGYRGQLRWLPRAVEDSWPIPNAKKHKETHSMNICMLICILISMFLYKKIYTYYILFWIYKTLKWHIKTHFFSGNTTCLHPALFLLVQELGGQDGCERVG